ncbi:MAG: phosphoenolpyruvate carboxykinase domain-containing protein, partial [Candidatus Hodarchaeales archaeon]
EGVRVHQPMANLDFVVVPLAKYLQAHIDFAKKLSKPDQIKVFSTNYFLKDEKGDYYDDKVDKKVWLTWAEGRIHGDYDAITTPIGYIPVFEDLKGLFKDIFNKNYVRERYDAEFSLRTGKWLDKLDRIEKIYENESGMPVEFTNELNNLRKSINGARKKFGMRVIPPSYFQ